MGDFAGKVVLITGAASGFGAATARRFAEMGAKLALSDVNQEHLETLAATLPTEVLTDHLDVSQERDHIAHLSRIKKKFGTLDIAINNAGLSDPMMPLTQIPVENFDRTMAVNARGVFLGMKHQLPLMLDRGKGAIVNISSAAGILGAGHLAAYAASKHAVVGLTRAAADEMARTGIRINAICPSFSETPLFKDLTAQAAKAMGTSPEDATKRIAARVPMRRVATVDEVVQAIVFAAHPTNSFMTGQAISVDGGLSAV